MELPNSIADIIDKRLNVDSMAKRDRGEVFTPLSFVAEMFLGTSSGSVNMGRTPWEGKGPRVGGLPLSVLRDPKGKWVDPAAGVGNFGVVAFHVLNEYLATAMPQAAKRQKHIIENMLYFIELDKTNGAQLKKIIGSLCPGAEPNVLIANTLSYKGKMDKLKADLGCSEFTVVMGNPPFNSGGTKLEGTKRLHVDFTEFGLELLAPGGRLLFVCPPNYREADSAMNKVFRDGGKGHFEFIRIIGADRTLFLFHIQARLDIFQWVSDDRNGKSGTKTIILDEYNQVAEVSIDLEKHLPNFGHTIFEKIQKKVKTLGTLDPFPFRTTEFSTLKAATFKCTGKKYKILHLITAAGKRVYINNKPHPLQTKKKIFLNGLGVPYVYYDKKGEYAPSQSPVIVLEPTDALAAFMKSAFFNFLVWGLRITGNNNLPYLFSMVPDVRSGAGSFTKPEDFVEFFGLTLAEKKFVFDSDEFKDPVGGEKDILENCGGGKKTRKMKN